MSSASVSSSAPSFSPDDLPKDKERLMVKIRDHIAFNGGRSTTRDIMDNLQMDVGKDDVVIFRKMIQTIATFGKDQDGTGVWNLKPDYR
ncbi:unnamed protein product [Absidia cylindrospora]